MAATVHSWSRPVPAKPRHGAGLPAAAGRAEGFASAAGRAEGFASAAERGGADRALLLNWAFTSLAAAGRQVAELEARLAHLESLTVTDELTKVLNRRGFLAELERALDAAREGGSGGVLMICDLDGFKAINDRHGHGAGNRALRDVAAALARRVRRTDAVARLGGDEFGLLLTDTPLATAERKSHCLGRAIAGLSLAVAGTRLALGASFGLAAYDGSESPEELLHRADMAMYEEKRRRVPRLKAAS